MYRPSRRVLAIGIVLCALLGALGVWVLLHPASIFVQPWRAERTASPVQDVLLGPYPVEADFVALKQRGVTTIISLLEPNVPYEKVLLEQERERAARHGMTVQNFPMGSILGQKFGDNYARNSKAAADAALNADGIAYIHCYLGLHRARNVQGYLAQHVRTGNYAGSNAVASAADLDNEHVAQSAFDAQDYQRSLAALAKIEDKGLRAARLEAWNYYRLRRIPEARARFRQVLDRYPADLDSLSGLAYSSLAENRLDEAELAFTQLLSAKADDVSALEGMGHVRYRQDRRDEARVLFERAAALNPGNAETQAMLERLRPAPAVNAATAPAST
ncbi:tetratricopeptide repeat protein [Lysobacter solisilvae (ex Woo and Kim 2020)]|uniref:Tetratricopeptide repeat protein n=1 Tax=Agrilutibacter terrestris TaxID=2865112 RepID=A0A7H0G0Q3_9GAMM|nr:tetratricopeptide repeat protein [Lysobacter terrestris]QNP41869.1 tetratricopeptide repeat protein [Lysobacter terrestris]